MEIELAALLPHAITGVVSGAIAWGGVRMEMSWMREKLDDLRYTVHSPKNPNNLVSKVQAHAFEIEAIKNRR